MRRAVLVGAGVWLAWLAYGALLVDPLLEPMLGWIATALLLLVAVLSFVPQIPTQWVWVLFAASLVIPRLPHVSLGLGLLGLVVRTAFFILASAALTMYRSGDVPLNRVVRTAWVLFAEHALVSMLGGAALVAYVLFDAHRNRDAYDSAPEPFSGAPAAFARMAAAAPRHTAASDALPPPGPAAADGGPRMYMGVPVVELRVGGGEGERW